MLIFRFYYLAAWMRRSSPTMAHNEIGLSTLVVGDCLKGTLPLARDCSAIEVTKTNVA